MDNPLFNLNTLAGSLMVAIPFTLILGFFGGMWSPFWVCLLSFIAMIVISNLADKGIL